MQNISQSHGLGPPPISGRASHTTDLQRFQTLVGRLKDGHRHNGHRAFSERVWQRIGEILSQCQQPLPYLEAATGEAVAPLTPQDVASVGQRVTRLALLNPIHPHRLAEAIDVDEDELLVELMYATTVGLTRMRWAPECERCGSAVVVVGNLQELPTEAACWGCQQPNQINSLDHISVTFHLDPDVLYVLANNYACTVSSLSAESNVCFAPMLATNEGAGFGCGFGVDETDLRPELAPGKYRMHCPVSMTDNFLVVERAANEDDDPIELDYRISEMVVRDATSARPVLTVPHGRIKMNVFPDTRSFFVLWIQENEDEDVLMRLPADERKSYTSAAQLINHSAFSLFSSQVVPGGAQALEVAQVALVFIDVVGSTNLYAHLGDGAALALVRQYFRAVFSAMASRGRIVKTIGDSVMASFSTTEAAVTAAAEAMLAVHRSCTNPVTDAPLQVRIGVHAGPTVVVPVNGINDYFGQTVNIAARVEGVAEKSQCLFSAPVLENPSTKAVFEELVSQSHFDLVPERVMQLRGISNPVTVTGFSLR